MFSEQMILEQIEVDNISSIRDLLNSTEFIMIKAMTFNSRHNYYSLEGTVEVKDNLLFLKQDNKQGVVCWVDGSRKLVNERISKLVEDRSFVKFRKNCHRGHLIANQLRDYTNYEKFNYSKNNPDNIYPQWINANINRAFNSEIFGQAYFENKVINKLKTGEVVHYNVKLIFSKGNQSYPIGNLIIAVWGNKQEDEKIFLEDNCNGIFTFIPNYLDIDIIK